MTFDPYGVLGLSRDATQEDIKAAFRRRSMASHPDHNPGNERAAVEFDRVKRAYEVLKDPEARARYDRTGEVEERQAATGDEASWGIIAGMLAQVLGADEVADPCEVDLVLLLRTAIRDEIAGKQKVLAKLKRAEKRATRMAGRFSRQAKAGEEQPTNMLEGILANQQAALAVSVKRAEQALAHRKRAVDLLEGYAFRADSPPMADWDPFSSALSGRTVRIPMSGRADMADAFSLWNKR
jgi:curved DNA-binding protein CbpA